MIGYITDHKNMVSRSGRMTLNGLISHGTKGMSPGRARRHAEKMRAEWFSLSDKWRDYFIDRYQKLDDF